MSKVMRPAKCRAQHYNLWMIEPTWFTAAVNQVKSGVIKACDDDGEYDDEPSSLYTLNEGVAVIEINGPIMKGWSKYGGTSSVYVRSAIREAVQDGSVQAILLHIDSPGGTVAGTAELAADVKSAAGQKPLHAHIEDLGASAAYWIASQASQITATATSEIGSIGTVMQLADTSGAYEKEGIKVYTLSTGAMKGAGFDGNPVTKDQIAYFQSRVDDINQHFLNGVKAGREMPIDDVRQVSDGRVYSAKDAISLDLIDDIGSFDDALKSIKKVITTANAGRGGGSSTTGAAATKRSAAMALTEDQLKQAKNLPGCGDITAENADGLLLSAAVALKASLVASDNKLEPIIRRAETAEAKVKELTPIPPDKKLVSGFASLAIASVDLSFKSHKISAFAAEKLKKFATADGTAAGEPNAFAVMEHEKLAASPIDFMLSLVESGSTVPPSGARAAALPPELNGPQQGSEEAANAGKSAAERYNKQHASA